MKTMLIIIIAGASLLVGCSTYPQHARQWEYKTVSGKVIGTENTLDAAINRETSDGWQFVSAGSAADHWGFAVMRREKR